jgi:hypothetical protein
MKYRTAGQVDWQDAITENISRSGVLFRAEGLLDLNSSIEMRVALPVGPSPERFPEVLCSGRVVRAVDRSSQQPRPAIAAAITSYHFEAAKDPLLD